MAHYKPEKLHVDLALELQDESLLRCYTLTHSDRTGDLFLTVGRAYDEEAISGWYTRLMRDEVLGEWQDEDGLSLHIHCHVSGGLVLGPAKWRDSIFRQHLLMVLEAICNGDADFFAQHMQFQEAPVRVHFHAKQSSLDRVEGWGCVQDYLINNYSFSNS